MYEINPLDDTVPEELVMQFARAVLSNPTNREHEALRICGGDMQLMQKLLQQATHPSFSQIVMRLQNEVSDVERLKTKTTFALEVQDKLGAMNGKLWLETAVFYAKLMGFTEEKTTQVNIQNVITVPPTQTVDEWQNGTEAYMQKLQAEAKVIDVDQ